MSMMRASGTREYQQSNIRRGEKESGRSWANLYVNGALACKQLAWQRRQRVEAGSEGAGCVDDFDRAGIYPHQQLRGRAGFSRRLTSKDLIFITIWRTTMGSSKDPIRFSASLFCQVKIKFFVSSGECLHRPRIPSCSVSLPQPQAPIHPLYTHWWTYSAPGFPLFISKTPAYRSGKEILREDQYSIQKCHRLGKGLHQRALRYLVGIELTAHTRTI